MLIWLWVMNLFVMRFFVMCLHTWHELKYEVFSRTKSGNSVEMDVELMNIP